LEIESDGKLWVHRFNSLGIFVTLKAGGRSGRHRNWEAADLPLKFHPVATGGWLLAPSGAG
jgi:hypothetical protein